MLSWLRRSCQQHGKSPVRTHPYQACSLESISNSASVSSALGLVVPEGCLRVSPPSLSWEQQGKEPSVEVSVGAQDGWLSSGQPISFLKLPELESGLLSETTEGGGLLTPSGLRSFSSFPPGKPCLCSGVLPNVFSGKMGLEQEWLRIADISNFSVPCAGWFSRLSSVNPKNSLARSLSHHFPFSDEGTWLREVK